MNVKTVGDSSFEDLISAADAKLQPIARSTRALIAEVLPGVTEVVWMAQKTVGYGVGPKKMSEHFCYLALHTHHLNLGFFYGADLEDPEELLEGSGKLLRHIKLSTPSDLTQSGVRQLMTQASGYLPKLGGRG